MKSPKADTVRLRRFQESWHWMRFLLLVAGGAEMGLGFWLAFRAHQLTLSAQTRGPGEDVIWLCVISGIVLLIGVAICARTLANWKGDPVVRLLLRLAQGTPEMGDGGSSTEPSAPVAPKKPNPDE